MPHLPRLDEQRRHFSRVLFNAGAHLTVDGNVIACDVLDLSLKGALVRPQGTHRSLPDLDITRGKRLVLTLELDGSDQIRMQATVVHVAEQRIGLHCFSIDLDSISHLRRLVELNVGDDDILKRELAALVADA